MQKDAGRTETQEKLKELHKLVYHCQEKKNKSEQILSELSKTQKLVQNNVKISPTIRTKLCDAYRKAIQSADAEAEALQNALNAIHEIRAINNEKRLAAKKTGRPKEAMGMNALMTMLQQTGRNIPLWIGKPGERPPPLCGAMPAEPNHIAKIGDMVAALVSVEMNEMWILAEVNYFDPVSNTYEVDDIESKEKKVHVISHENVFPLPLMKANPELNPEAFFQKGMLISALHPSSTCFYAGVVDEPPSKSNEDYRILFEDSSCESGYSSPCNVCQRYVLNYRPSHFQVCENEMAEE